MFDKIFKEMDSLAYSAISIGTGKLYVLALLTSILGGAMAQTQSILTSILGGAIIGVSFVLISTLIGRIMILHVQNDVNAKLEMFLNNVKDEAREEEKDKIPEDTGKSPIQKGM